MNVRIMFKTCIPEGWNFVEIANQKESPGKAVQKSKVIVPFPLGRSAEEKNIDGVDRLIEAQTDG